MMIGHLTTALVLVLAQTAPAATQRPCITQQEAGAMAAVALPELVEAFAQRCSQHLPETAYLKTQGTELVQRWRSEAAPQREAAFAGMARMAPPARPATPPAEDEAGTAPAPAANAPSPEVGMRAMIGGLAGGMSTRLNPTTCAELSRFVESLAPLPATNVAQMFSAAIGFGMAMMPANAQGGPPICRS